MKREDLARIPKPSILYVPHVQKRQRHLGMPELLERQQQAAISNQASSKRQVKPDYGCFALAASAYPNCLSLIASACLCYNSEGGVSRYSSKTIYRPGAQPEPVRSAPDLPGSLSEMECKDQPHGNPGSGRNHSAPLWRVSVRGHQAS